MYGIIVQMQLKRFLILLLFFLGSCSKHVDKLQNLPFEFVNRLQKAATIDDIFQPAKMIKLASSDTVFLGDITYLNITKDGRLVTLDRANRTPLLFDSTGKFLGKIGYFGAGPGEFERASAVCYDDSNQIWYVADNSLMRISLFRNSGEYLRDFKIKAAVQELQVNQRGEVCLFMPNKRDGNLVECQNANGEILSSFLNSDIIQKLPFALFGGGLCLTRNGILAAHYLSSDLSCFDYKGKRKFKFNLKQSKNYIPPSDPEKVRDGPAFLASFTGIMKIFRGPFGVILVEYGRTLINRTPKGNEVKLEIYFVFLTEDGKELASGIASSIGYFASDHKGRLYSVEYPLTSNQQEVPVVKQWTLKNF